MGFAFILPGDLSDVLPPELAAEFRRTFGEPWDALSQELRTTRPLDDSAAERAALRRLTELTIHAWPVLGALQENVATAGLNRAQEQLLRHETQTTDFTRRLAIRRLQDALKTFGVMAEYARARIFPELDEEAVERALSIMRAVLERPSLPASTLVPLRAQLDLFVALDCSLDPHAETEELAYWSERAATGARRLEALMHAEPLVRARGEMARLRARYAWADWTDEDIKREFEPWPDSPP